MSRNSMNKMDRLLWTWGLILSVFSLAVVAYRNDLSSTRHGCIWSTIETNVKETTSPSSSSNSNIKIFPKGLIPSSPSLSSGNSGVSLNCNLRTFMDSWNYTFNREQIEQTRLVKVKCSEKIFFESFLTPNQTLFQLRNLKELQIESCKIRKMPKRVWASLTKLKTLVIRTQNTEWSSSVGLDIEQGAFEGLELNVLDLSYNNIWTFPDLCPLRSLLMVNMSHNQLSDIEELTSAGGVDSSISGINRDNDCALSVKNLDLGYNTIRRLGNNAFSRMKKISELRVENNLLEELEDSAFGGLSQLKVLNISSNRFVAIPPYIFKSNSNLREVYLQNNSISALSSQVFENMDQLQAIDLSQNSLTSQWIKDDIFHGLIRLVVLKLSWNQLSYIDSVIFRDLISLQALHLDNNRLETINPEAFQTLSNLHILDLTNNKLTFIDAKIFSNLFVLQRLYLDRNKLRKMDDLSLKNCTSLQDLGLGGNSFTEVPVALQASSLGRLQTIDLGENKLVQISNESFSGMGLLYGLRLVDNLITELPQGFCDPLISIRVLNVGQNRINKISSSLSCPELRILRLDTNNLQELPSNFTFQFPSLLWLNASQNRINKIPSSVWDSVSKIEWLDLSYNSLESLSQPLTSEDQTNKNTNSHLKPYHLRVLDVSYNKIKHLDNTVIPSSLETLRVNHNELKSVAPDTFIRSSRIRRVELIGNQIENLPLTSLRFPAIPSGHTLPEFYLGGNPFLCDCSMEWLTRVNQLSILRQHPRIVDLDAIFCGTSLARTTTTNQVVPLVEMRPKDFLCPYKSHCFALCHCCEFEACDCEMTCPDNCTCYHDNAWASNIVQCSNLDYEDIPSRIPMDATEIYLDGNRVFELKSHGFIGKKNLRTLNLNNSHIEFIKNKTFNGLKSLAVLHLEDNLLTELHGFEFSDLLNISELYLQNNLIGYISKITFSGLKFLSVLRLDGNRLFDFNAWELSGNGYLNSVMLAGNPWNCDCEFLIPFRNWVATKSSIVVDFTLANCQTKSSSSEMDYYTEPNPKDKGNTDLDVKNHASSKLYPTPVQYPISSMCNHNKELNFNFNPIRTIEIESELMSNNIPAMGASDSQSSDLNSFSPLETDVNHHTFWILILCLCAILLLVFGILLIFRQELYYWSKNSLLHGVLGFCTSTFCCFCCAGKNEGRTTKDSMDGDNSDKLFDVYIIYGKNEQDFVAEKIAPQLELGNHPGGPKFRICLQYRDICVNDPCSTDMMLSACNASKRILLILSRSFYQNEFSKIVSVINQYQSKVILIHLPDLPPFTAQNLSQISSNIDKNYSLEWNDENFWHKLQNLLPIPSNNSRLLNHGDMSANMNYTNCDPHQLPYNLIMNPNLHHLNQTTNNTLPHLPHHYHQNIIPYQIPMMTRNNSLPPVPKHQIVLPAVTQLQNSNWQGQSQEHYHPSLQQNTNGLLNPYNNHHHYPSTLSKNYEQQQPQEQHNHNAIILPNNHSLIHPIPSQLTPQPFGYSNEAFHLQQSNHNLPNHHHHNHSGRNNNQPIHFSSAHLQQNPLPHQPISVIPPHSHSSSQVSNSNFSSGCCYSHHNPQFSQEMNGMVGNMEQNYSSSAVSSANGEFDHVYSTLDSPLQSPNSNIIGFSPNGRDIIGDNGGVNCSRVNQHQTQHSTSSGISSGSDMTSGDISGSSAVSPSSPIKNGILNKLNGNKNNSMNNPNGNNGKMYFV